MFELLYNRIKGYKIWPNIRTVIGIMAITFIVILGSLITIALDIIIIIFSYSIVWNKYKSVIKHFKYSLEEGFGEWLTYYLQS